MAKLADVMAFLIREYPEYQRRDLSNARLTKLIYLSDWHQSLVSGRQITPIKWYFDNYGPYVNDVREEAMRNLDLFELEPGTNALGGSKLTIGLKDLSYQPQLEERETKSLTHVIEVTSPLIWADFIKLVYATHPIASSERYTYLDLVAKARDYKPSRVA